MRALSQGTLEAGADTLLRQFPADEDDAAQARLVAFPFTLMVAVENHMHALEHEAFRIILERENALAAQNVLALRLDQGLHPGKELVRIERLLGLERHRLHLFVMIVLEPARMVIVRVPVMTVIVVVRVIMPMIVSMIMTSSLEEFGLDVQDAIEIEGIAAQNLPQRNRATLGPVHLGIRIDGADAPLDLLELG